MGALGIVAIFVALFGVTWAWLAQPPPHDLLWLSGCLAMTAVCTMIGFGGALCLAAAAP